MKILIVTQYFWPENFRINDIALRLKEKGHDVGVLTGLPNYPSGKIFPGWGPFKRLNEVWEGIPIKRFPHFPRGNKRILGMAANFISFALLGSLLAPFLIKDQYDVIFVYEPSPITVGFPAIVLKKIKNIPIVFWVQDLWPESLSSAGNISNKKIIQFTEFLVRYIYKQSDVILAQSLGFIESIKRYVDPGKAVVYYPQGAESVFEKMNLEKKEHFIGILPKGFKILFAGNIGESQDFNTILKAATATKNIKEIKWIIAGDGRMKEWVSSEIVNNGLEDTVHLIGSYPLTDMPSLFHACEALLVTLKKHPIYSITIPSKVQSYLASGKPIIAALDGEGGRILRESGAGSVVDSGDASGLAEQICALYKKSKSSLEEMGKKGHLYYLDKFNSEDLLDQLEVILREASGRRKGNGEIYFCKA